MTEGTLNEGEENEGRKRETESANEREAARSHSSRYFWIRSVLAGHELHSRVFSLEILRRQRSGREGQRRTSGIIDYVFEELKLVLPKNSNRG